MEMKIASLCSLLLFACEPGKTATSTDSDGTLSRAAATVTLDSNNIYVDYPIDDDNVYNASVSVKMLIKLDPDSPYTPDEINRYTWHLFSGSENTPGCLGLSASDESWDFIATLPDLFAEVSIDTSNWVTGVYYLCVTSPELDFAFISGSLRISADGVPLAPMNFSGSKVSVNSLNLSWTDNSDNEIKFRLERKTSDAAWTTLLELPPGSETYLDKSILPGSSYDYRIFAVNDQGDSPPSAIFSFAFAAETQDIAAPFGLAMTDRSMTTIDLQWIDASSIEATYEVERSNDGVAGWSSVAALAANSTTHQDSGLSPLTTYYYRTKAKNGASESEPSAVMAFTTIGPPQTPTAFKAGSKNQAMSLTWTSAQNVLVVKSTTGPVTWTPTDLTDYDVGSLDASHELIYKGSAQSFEDSGLTNGTAQYYAIFADNGLLQYSVAATYQARPESVTSMALGGLHMCVTVLGNRMYCWGMNGNGQLGDNNAPTEAYYPVNPDTAWMQDHDAGQTLPVTIDFKRVASNGDSFSTCSVNSDNGYAHCWGSNAYEKLGNQWHSTNSVRLYMAVDNNGTQLAYANIGEDFACGIDPSGNGYCWGRNTSDGNLGIGSSANLNYDSAQALNTSSTYSTIIPGLSHACALTTSNGVECWGSNWYGELGRGAVPGDTTSPAAISLSRTWIQVGTGNLHSCALDNTGSIYCWGYDTLGAIGDGDRDANLDPDDGVTDTPSLVDMSGLGGATFTKMAVGQWSTCALTSNSKIYCWGRNPLARVTAAVNYFSPTEMFTTGLPTNFSAEEISIGFHDNFGADFGGKICLRLTAGELFCTGSGSRGQLAQGDTVDHLNAFVQINFQFP